MEAIDTRWNVIFIVTTLQFSHINNHIIHLFPTLSLSFLTIFLFINFSTYNYSSSNISPFFKPFYLSITLYLNVIISPSIQILLFWLFFSPFIYYKIFLFSLSIVCPHKKWILSLSLSLSLSLYIYIYIFFSFFWWIFNSLFIFILG